MAQSASALLAGAPLPPAPPPTAEALHKGQWGQSDLTTCKGRSKRRTVAGRKRQHLEGMLAGSGSSFHGSWRVWRGPLLWARVS